MIGFNPIASAALASGPLETVFRIFQVLCMDALYSPERLFAGQYSPERLLIGEYSPERLLIGNLDFCDDEE